MKLLNLVLSSALLTTCIHAQDTSSAFSDLTDNGDGSFTNWIGTFSPVGELSTTGFIDHAEHGRLYVSASGQDVWIYDANVAALGADFHGWLYTSRTIFPYFYVAATDPLYVVFLPGVEGPAATPRVFLNTASMAPLLLSDRTTADIVDTAVAAGVFSSLVTAVSTADLVGTLKSPGPFTVFAPTDDAFAKLDSATLNDLLTNPDSLPALTDILLYHVVSGEYSAADLGFDATDWFAGESSTRFLDTVLGTPLKVEATPFGVLLNGSSMVATPNVETANGIVHIVDSVILPPADIVDTAVAAGLSSLATAVTEASLIDTLKGDGPFTVFAPIDSAFAALGSETLNTLFDDANIADLQDILLYHVISGAAVFSADVAPGSVTMANGDTATITADDNGTLFINGAEIITTDINTRNGVVHLIDTVILPPVQ